METPILFIIFNRPETTKIVFEIIRQIRPQKLFVAGDGPRENNIDDIEKVDRTRDIIKSVDWSCEVKTLFREKNLGCKIGVSSAIDWFFENVEEGIILEDDCVPDLSFFYFCKEMLSRYKNNSKIMMVSGDNFQNGIIRGDGSYYISKIGHIWGWATWKRAWKIYDVSMESFPEFEMGRIIESIFDYKKISNHWLKSFERAYSGKIDTWDIQWVYSLFRNNGYSVVPNVNLVLNNGFGTDATHTTKISKYANIPSLGLNNLIEPSSLLPNKEADIYECLELLKKPSILARILNRIKN